VTDDTHEQVTAVTDIPSRLEQTARMTLITPLGPDLRGGDHGMPEKKKVSPKQPAAKSSGKSAAARVTKKTALGKRVLGKRVLGKRVLAKRALGKRAM
jgi:hypothetical protein